MEKGTIEQVQKKTSSAGKPYLLVKIDGVSYGVWNEELFTKIVDGTTVNFLFSENGEYKNITAVLPDGSGGVVEVNKFSQNVNASFNGDRGRQDSIEMQSARKDALALLQLAKDLGIDSLKDPHALVELITLVKSVASELRK